MRQGDGYRFDKFGFTYSGRIARQRSIQIFTVIPMTGISSAITASFRGTTKLFEYQVEDMIEQDVLYNRITSLVIDLLFLELKSF